MEPVRKRARLEPPVDTPDASTIRAQRAGLLASLSRQVSPPIADDSLAASKQSDKGLTNKPSKRSANSVLDATALTTDLIIPESNTFTDNKIKNIPSPIQLTRIRDLAAGENVDTVSLHDLLADPLIKEAWIFNFCFDVDWTMQHFDPDVRQLVKVKIIHGSWRREDLNKIYIDEACARWPNVESIQAYLPDAFGTHHSKMFVLFRHDDQAQVIIHTANMLSKDWTNMTQAVWKSPLLPLLATTTDLDNKLGSGPQFKHDLLRYFKAYGNKLRSLVKQTELYDFSEVKAALIASVPSDFAASAPNDEVWGHEALRRTLKTVPVGEDPHFVYQVSSIASLPATWLVETLYSATGGSSKSTSIIFPTAEDVRISLDGYAAGGSIHTKAQKDIHLKQISAMRAQMRRWSPGPIPSSQAGRHQAAPHIKTFIRFATNPSIDNPSPNIDWALVTSSNLSTQAWGSAAKLPKGTKDASEARINIQSFEIGVLVWPALYARSVEEASQIKMVPTFKTDLPAGGNSAGAGGMKVGFRMPYDLPLTSYGPGELPWSPQSSYSTLDSHGMTWPPGT